MSCFLDSSVLIGFYNRRDEKHELAVSLLSQAVDESAFGQLYLSDYVVDEVLTNIYSNTGRKADVVEFGKYLFSSDFEMLFMDSDAFLRTWQLFQKSTDLSFTDCSIVELMRQYHIDQLLSFDSGFDQVEIKRIG